LKRPKKKERSKITGETNSVDKQRQIRDDNNVVEKVRRRLRKCTSINRYYYL
jgi:hypothetical protein